ncbi:hypothetical protein NYE25_12270 [Paenibacillus sp. FSL E2-8871]|uniref:hypothetical protein n=1 Tax=Paenibacillus sp. FSL E2-8871 TaxID=2975326 RepID=UPI0030F5AD05
MDISSSIAYRRFLNDYYHEFRMRHYTDVIDFLEDDEEHTFDQFLLEYEVYIDVEANFSYAEPEISNELADPSIAQKNSENRVYADVIKMIKVKLKDAILNSSAYYHLAERII